ncbi:MULTISPECIES: nickel transporter permease [Metabacillus]|uniref:ABC transporter permease subunit n=1 Tax=Metabacillus hrfriensis TaxID=3048891 RepID=A0ACD4RIM2_9BACI|nr:MULTISPECIES: nickel transporter permease [Metabacillus]UAL54836.1 ABC transporter permease subunit [Metabacillus dongyingensis]WHZ60329.1 ABC transporter permease subunit [Metabacillus sp. CT-WN-B3]
MRGAYRMNSATMTWIGIISLSIIVLITLLGPILVPNDPLTANMAERLSPPSLTHPLGTDHMGRCIFSRLVIGSQATLGITSLVIAAVVLIGIPFGLLSGYIGGRIDTLIMRLADGLAALPEFILAIAIAGFLGPSLVNLMISVVLVKWISYTRVVRGIVLSEREKEYVLAAKVGGCPAWKIIIRHLLPQILSPVLVLAALDVGKVILIISSLSYLGLGAQPPAPEWGAMLNDGRPYFQTFPEMMVYPGLAIFLVVLSCNLIGEGLRDKLDVKSI